MAETSANYEFSFLYVPGTMSVEELRDRQRVEQAVLIGADGSVPEASLCGLEPFYVADHHQGDKVTRQQTPATCRQIDMLRRNTRYQQQAARLGKVILIANGYDPDIAESNRILDLDSQNWYAGASTTELVRSNVLTKHEDKTDRSSGRYLLSLPAWLAGELAYVYYPAMDLRLRGINSQQDIEEAQDQVNSRGMEFVQGRPGSVDMDQQYEVLDECKDTVVIEEVGAFAVVGAMRHWPNIVSQRTNRKTGQRQVALHSEAGTLTPQVYAELNRLERELVPGLPDSEVWGGCEITGGSPRGAGTQTPNKAIAKVLSGAATRLELVGHAA